MRKIYLSFVLFYFFLFSCTTDHEEFNEIKTDNSKEEQKEKISHSQLLPFAQIYQEKQFQLILKQLNVSKIQELGNNKFSNEKGNVKIKPHSRVDITRFGKNVSYSFLIESRNELLSLNQFRNLVLENRNGESSAMIVTYLLENNELLPIKIEQLNSSTEKTTYKSTCQHFTVTVKTWCSKTVHYGYDSECQASEKGATYTNEFNACSGGGADYGSTTLISGPNYYFGDPDSGGTGGGTSGGTGGGPSGPPAPGGINPDEPFAGPVLEDVLVSYKPTLRYPIDSDYAQEYPKLTEYLRNKLPNVKDMPVITNAIQEITTLSLSQIQQDLEWGNGPTIVIQQLDNHTEDTNVDTVGLFDERYPEILFLDIDWVDNLEDDNFDENLVQYFGLQANRDAFLFFLGATVLHEYVHYGDFINGNNYVYPQEEGDMFEMRVYGEDVDSGTLLFSKN